MLVRTFLEKHKEKIAVKVNINGSGVFDGDSSRETNMSYTNPVLLKCLLASLVNKAGVILQSMMFPGYFPGTWWSFAQAGN